MVRMALLSLILMSACVGCSTGDPWRQLPDVSPTMWGSGPSHVSLEPQVWTQLRERWIETHEDSLPEFAACLEGELITRYVLSEDGQLSAVERSWQVTGFTIPPLHDARRRSIGAIIGGCEGYPGRLHSHPMDEVEDVGLVVCARSDADRKGFWRRGFQFEIVLCGKDSYRWYTRNGEQGGVGAGVVPHTIEVKR